MGRLKSRKYYYYTQAEAYATTEWLGGANVVEPIGRYTDLLPAPEKTSLKRLWLAPLVVLALLLAISFLGVRWVGSHFTKPNLILHQTKSGWQKLPAPEGLPEGIQVSSGGTVWVRTLGKSAMRRWDGKAWIAHNIQESSAEMSYDDVEFALDGEQVWAPTWEGVLNWDGQRWHIYKESVAAEFSSIVAGDGQVWVVDHAGKFSHFEGGRWQSSTLALPGVTWIDKPTGYGPELARTANGVVWMVWQGIWRLDGSKWSPVTVEGDNLKEASLIGAAGDHLWLSDDSGVRSVSMDGKHFALYTSEQIGIPGYMIRRVASTGGRTSFGTSLGILEFDGSAWRQSFLPAGGAGVGKIAAGPGGELWVISAAPAGSSAWNLRYLLPITLLLPLSVLGVAFWISQRLRRRRLQQHQRVAQAVQYATGEVPTELEHGEQQLKRHDGIATAVLVVGTIAGFTVLRQLWPKTPVWTIGVIGLVIHLATTLQQSLVKRKAKASDPIGPGGPARYDWGKTWKAAASGTFLLLVIYADRFPMLQFLRGYAFWILIVAPIGYGALMVRLLNGAARRGDYDGAMKIIRRFYFYNPSGMEPMRMSGHMLLLAGRYREAEDTLRRSLVGSHARQSYGFALEYLGDALMEQGRYDEAMRSYEAALHAFPSVRRPYRGMAEMLLRQDKNPVQALEYVESILDFAGLSWNERQGNGKAQDDYWALKAWALARIGRSSEVAPAIEQALKATNLKSLPDLATAHYRAGMAMHALGEESAAKEYFQRAVEFDPQGRRGMLSKTALRERSAGLTWGEKSGSGGTRADQEVRPTFI